MGHRPPKPTGCDVTAGKASPALRDDGTSPLLTGQPPGSTGDGRTCPDAGKTVDEHSTIHSLIKLQAAAHPGDKIERFGAGATARHYILDGNIIDKLAGKHVVGQEVFIHQYKAYFVHGMRDPIKAAAALFGLPPVLLAGTAYNEVGGSDAIKPEVYTVRSWWPHWMPGYHDPDTTSLGATSIQVRNAVHTLGYDPNRVSARIKGEIVDSLIHDNAFSIYTTAKHLSDLRDRYYPGQSAQNLNSDAIAVLGARYNRGTAPSSEQLAKDLSYGQAILRRKDVLEKLLTDEPVSTPDWSEPLKKAAEKAGEAWSKAAEGGYPLGGF